MRGAFLVPPAPIAILMATLLSANILACGPYAWAWTPDEVPPAQIEKTVTPDERTVQLVICLDTSGSMSGLLNAARQKLWTVVNDLAMARPTPDLEIALLSYGNDGYNAEDGWVKILVPFTEDLDLVSQRLFELTTNGGTELVARVLDKAVTQLDWDVSEETLKLIFVAGNESANQDTVIPYADVCARAIASGIMVNSIYCGDPMDDIARDWRQVSTLADGHYAAIDQETGLLVIESPFDKRLAELSMELNDTYIPYGSAGLGCSQNQYRQDANAIGVNRVAAAQRCQVKASRQYNCASWDLVDATAREQLKLEDVKDEDLPESMRKMTLEERRAHVDAQRERRRSLQEEITELGKKREEFVEAEMNKHELDDGSSFDRAVRTAVRAQARLKGFEFDEPKPAPKPVPTGAEVEESVADAAPEADPC